MKPTITSRGRYLITARTETKPTNVNISLTLCSTMQYRFPTLVICFKGLVFASMTANRSQTEDGCKQIADRRWLLADRRWLQTDRRQKMAANRSQTEDGYFLNKEPMPACGHLNQSDYKIKQAFKCESILITNDRG